ncbi:MAG: YabP/YqfC family sporulation protein [Clostridiales bacterium]|nr:YabP/YqfC family sporulation protein [Clostridiales bacterium]
MSFVDQISKMFGALPEFKFQATLFGGNAIYVEGGKPIKLDDDEMVFKVNGGMLTVVGESMSVKELTGDCVAIVGEIKSVAVEKL